MYRDGRLSPVPAGKSDIFQDRSLKVADKRVVMRFLNNVVQAGQGQGPLKV